MSTFKHDDDSGELSIIAAGDQILIACTGGHYWLIDSEMHDVKPSKSRTLPKTLEKFGPDARRAMRLT